MNQKIKEQEKNAPEIIICKSCGADFDASQPNCPYCGTMNLPAAEKAYMQKLEGIRTDLHRMGQRAEKETKKHFGRLGKKLLIFALVLLVALALGFGLYARHEKAQAAREREQYLWQREYFAKLDECYAAADYDALCDLYYLASVEGRPVYSYKHDSFCNYLVSIAQAEAESRYATPGTDQSYLFYSEINLYRLERLWGISEEEREILAQLRAPILEDFEARFQLTPEEMLAFQRILEKEDCVSYKACAEFLETRGDGQ